MRAWPLLLLALATQQAFAAPATPTRCASGTAGGQAYRWCSFTPKSPRPRTVAYYLHGNGGSEKDSPLPGIAELEAKVKAKGGALPTIITISFGPTWFLGTHGGVYSPGLLPALTEAGRQVEGALGIPANPERWVLGESMGGFNALQLYFHRPKDFTRVVAYCPAVLPFSPFAPQGTVDAFLARHAPYVVAKLVNKWRDKLASAYPSQKIWEAHDPLLLAAKAPATPLFMGAQGRDAFAFHEASQKLEQTLRSAGAKITWQFLPAAAHCEYSAGALDSLANFLAR